MTPVDTFLDSVRAAFKPADGLSASSWAAVALGILLLAGLARWRARSVRGRRNDADFARLLLERGVSAADGGAIVRLAKIVALPPLVVATRLDAFERATARALAGQPPPAVTAGNAVTPPDDGNDVFARVRRLRRALGFHVVPDHVPLLTTRELVPGMRVAVDAVGATVVDVNEGWFAVVAGDAPLNARALGTEAPVTLTRGHDARYVARCPLLSVEPVGASRKWFFRHDEKPLRQQLRAAVRVNAQGTVALTPHGASVPSTGPAPGTLQVQGTLIDISVGGCALETPTALPIGQALHASITWSGESYRELPASVLHCDARGAAFLVRLAFHGLSAEDDARLSAAIARHSGRLAGAA